MRGVAAVTTGLSAGVLYAYGCSVILALDEVDDRAFVDVMQRINDRIENRVFCASFFGALTLPVAAAGLQRRFGPGTAGRWMVAAFGSCLVAFVVTVAANVPLNAALARAVDPATIPDLAAVRNRFEGPWAAWNVVRAVAATAALNVLGWELAPHREGA